MSFWNRTTEDRRRKGVVDEQAKLQGPRLHESGPVPPWDDTAPIRGEIFGLERLKKHARNLAAEQSVVPMVGRGAALAMRLEENEFALRTAYRDIIDTVDTGAAITPAAEWFIDNFHLVEKQISCIKADLPSGYYRQLPKLAFGPFANYPRVFGIAWSFVSHSDSLFDPDLLQVFLTAYQEVQLLTIGELWAVAITLRIVLVENLGRITTRIVDSRAGRLAADVIADKLLAEGGQSRESVIKALNSQADHQYPNSFLVQLIHRLRDQGPSIEAALEWLESQLVQQGMSVDEVVHDEHQKQISASVTVQNIITSMRLISDTDWPVLFEKVSSVDSILIKSISFLEMDFPTRNMYRSAIEELARGSGLSEIEVTHAAVAIAAASQSSYCNVIDARLSDPGYYLIARGRPKFERQIGVKIPFLQTIVRAGLNMGLWSYLCPSVVLTLILLSFPLFISADIGVSNTWLVVMGLLAFIPTVDLSVTAVNYALTRSLKPALLASLDFHEEIPSEYRTLIVVPILLVELVDVNSHVEQLEIHYLSCPKGALHFALLSDWCDAPNEHMDGDNESFEAAKAAIGRLNERYGSMPGGERFFLLHRGRRWSECEQCWMAWERKRGKLHELNRLLRGATDTSFLFPAIVPEGVRYVITLDADTRLPHETVWRLIGKMAHPLNRPRFDAATQRVIEGYGILQPRVTPSLPVGSKGSVFLNVFASTSGIDPYAAAVSDVYQDLFGEGSYTGKGIYDVDTFEAALNGRVEDSTLLSHDLFEGTFARAGLASDVEVIEEFPSRYDVAACRLHRWARGDWQLLPWIFGRRGHALGAEYIGGVSAVGRWKMLDNLRRSLSPLSVVSSLVVSLALPVHLASLWIGFVLVTIFLPPLIPVIAIFAKLQPGVSWFSHFRVVCSEVFSAITHSSLVLIFMADQACLMTDAILRTLVRLGFTRRHLLEWVPSAQASFGTTPGIQKYYERMGGSLIIASCAVIVTFASSSGNWPFATIFALVWFAAPAIAYQVSQSRTLSSSVILSRDDVTSLRLVARETWRYFETFVSEADHNLPPDNFQETPVPIVAHRTSPTNIGLYLMSAVSARDLGWIGVLDCTRRLEATFLTMSIMIKFRGHFLNWYSTRDLHPLEPQYVSSVDSGNLAGHLIAVANACREWRIEGTWVVNSLEGVCDSLLLARRHSLLLNMSRRSRTAIWDRFDIELDAFLISGRESGLKAEFGLQRLLTLKVLSTALIETTREIVIGESDESISDVMFWVESARNCLESLLIDLYECPGESLSERLFALEKAARAMVMSMEFDFLLDSDRLLFSIGYQVREGKLDMSCYDLLASESMLASFIAIAKGDAPARHWFRLSREVTSVDGGAALMSWSGSMFEYLMTSLVISVPSESLIENSNRLIVSRQIEYGKILNTPWGVSESAFNVRDLEFTYQYCNFGVPGLGLKRGLGNNSVIAPYATALASMINPFAAIRNFEHLEMVGARGRYGFFEAVDFTVSRIPKGDENAVVRAFMAHHQGMTIVSIANVLLDGMMRCRFHAEPMIQASELLLQERVPREIVDTAPAVTEMSSLPSTRYIASTFRTASPWSGTPATQILSNGSYSVILTAAGSGYSTWGNLSITRWREDATCDDWGAYILLRDVSSGFYWSATYQPSGAEPDSYEVLFNEDHAEFIRRDGNLTTTLRVLVSTEDDAEARRLTIVNLGQDIREIEITSYAELVLTSQAADVVHPTFSKLFVETEYLAGVGAILATRRRRSPEEPEVWAAHLAVVDGPTLGKREFETDRGRFLGRGGSIRAPFAAVSGRPLSGETGAVLDPIFALRRRVRILPGATARIDFWTMVASSREEALNLVDRHHDTAAFERAAALAWTQAHVELHHLGIEPSTAGQYQRLAGHVIYATSALRPASEYIEKGSGSQSGLWNMGVSGDLPIILVQIADTLELDIVRDMLLAVEYWRTKLLAVDLVILNDCRASYTQDLQIGLETLVRASQSRSSRSDERPSGHIFILRADLISLESRALLSSVARVVLMGKRGGVIEQLDRIREAKPALRAIDHLPTEISDIPVMSVEPVVEFFNGLGGFAADGHEYVIVLGPGQSTPAPWINVIANPSFGFQVSAEGCGYTWALNSRERQITPWSNDPITDRSGEVFYIRDEATGRLWSPTAFPIREATSTYSASHGWGYSRFELTTHGLTSELLQFVPLADTIKISRLTLRNHSKTAKRLSVTTYTELVLGASRSTAAPFITTRLDPDTTSIMATNPWHQEFRERVTFADLKGQQQSWTCDRREFIGRNGSLVTPKGLASKTTLSGLVGSGIDPCIAMQTIVDIPPNGSVEVVFFLGDALDEAEARSLITRYRAADLEAILNDVRTFWETTLTTIQVKTPDRSMDLILNGWLVYQTLACRVWARSGFYQAGGAYGFRDQLQDCMALASIQPSITREHLLRCAGRQFADGDVQHWWLPYSGLGVRTRISDDRVWLVYATAHYVSVTGDNQVLDTLIPFLSGPSLRSNENEAFFQPSISCESGNLYEHCARALDASMALGVHGLPLIGSGDWNDGMNRVGIAGKGESVWLGWFLYATLTAFLPIAEARGDGDRYLRWSMHVKKLDSALENDAWDGEWYRRGWFDNGSPLGSGANEECRIDSIAQSWAAISGAAPVDRVARSMAAVERELIRPQIGLALLFSPPFNRSIPDPGYIGAYPPGVRENGGQYTHAALWSVMAFARLGEGNKALALFSLLNPINHARTRSEAQRYKVEPYVVAADIYASGNDIGRGGWTWYTGSAGWMQRAGIESILGLYLEGGALRMDPRIPGWWPGYEITLRHHSSRYLIVVENPLAVQAGISDADLDGMSINTDPLRVVLVDDGAVHRLSIRMG